MHEWCQIIPIEAVPHARGCVFAPARVSVAALMIQMLIWRFTLPAVRAEQFQKLDDTSVRSDLYFQNHRQV
jgi:hypothetical protein